jgi:hypothetical protein
MPVAKVKKKTSMYPRYILFIPIPRENKKIRRWVNI